MVEDFLGILEWLQYDASALHNQASDIVVATDASGTWGCGTIWDNQWLQCQWVSDWEEKSIVAKKLLSIVLVVTLWGQQWCHQLVIFRRDNMAVVQVVNSQNSRDP